MKLDNTTLDRIVLKKIEYPRYMDRQRLEKWIETLPNPGPDDPNNPEWPETPIRELDLSPWGYNAVVYVKDESVNKTGTIKIRKAHENGPILYGNFARNLWAQHSNGRLERVRIPILTEISSGNMITSQSDTNKEWGLPPPTYVLDASKPKEELEKFMDYYANIVLVPLDRNIFTGKREPYNTKQLLRIGDNVGAMDVTSSNMIPFENYYDWHIVHEAFNFNPDMIFLPYGSGELRDGYLIHQRKTAYNGLKKKDVRLRAYPWDVTSIDLLAAEPRRKMHSEADKLIGMKPYIHLNEQDVRAMKLLKFTGQNTGRYSVEEKYINLAHKILTEAGIDAEKSAAAGLGLYLQMYEKEKIDPRKKVLIINTGKGI